MLAETTNASTQAMRFTALAAHLKDQGQLALVWLRQDTQRHVDHLEICNEKQAWGSLTAAQLPVGPLPSTTGSIPTLCAGD
jgi:hypothetical protein